MCLCNVCKYLLSAQLSFWCILNINSVGLYKAWIEGIFSCWQCWFTGSACFCLHSLGWRANPSTWTRHQCVQVWRTVETSTALGEYTPTWSWLEPLTSTVVTLELFIFFCFVVLFPLLMFAVLLSAEQAEYNRPKVVERCKPKEGKDVLEACQFAQRLQSMVGTWTQAGSARLGLS